MMIMTLADNETQASETKYTEACWSNYPRRKAPWDNESQTSEDVGEG